MIRLSGDNNGTFGSRLKGCRLLASPLFGKLAIKHRHSKINVGHIDGLPGSSMPPIHVVESGNSDAVGISGHPIGSSGWFPRNVLQPFITR
jgi:hypothetical protein